VTGFGEFVARLGSSLLQVAGGPDAGVALVVTSVDLSLPLEATLRAGAELEASLPRGMMSTGFELPLGRIVARFELVSEGDA
jgi:hypothetical protein